ncbi:hypothetical protein COMNV_01000 [Commensalibacter sp. Nvir]|uniref:AtpZ/AtpI family protein n=1 Tax=Commensalibacter sp. Nvir TaxID=3069817 RepID=UPI002D68D579|nr:hypothetical protein COMNV_01000 [Commensalibacter sp. Nvir]
MEKKKKKKLDSFDRKLQDFESRLNASKKEPYFNLSSEDKELWRIVIRAGVELFSVFFVSVVIGYGLDYWLSTSPLFIVLFSLLGVCAGVLNVWRMVNPNDKRLK